MEIREVLQNLDLIENRVLSAISILGIESKKIKMKDLQFVMSESDFWNDSNNAQKIAKEFSSLNSEVNFWESLKVDIQNLREICDEDLNDKTVNLLDEINKTYFDIVSKFEKEEFTVLFSGNYDKNNAILSIHSGAGGDDAQDFSSILLRMYCRFFDKKGFSYDIINETRGGEVGIKSITLSVRGDYAYGYLRGEYGVHRLIRISPFDSDKARHTSFSLVEVLPELDEINEISINDEDIRIDTFMSGGHGGQSVNTTYSAVRITHIPTNIVVSCQNERSQLQNKEFALKMLKAKLLELKKKELLDEKNNLKGDYKKIEWGSQIRTYVMHPYKQVKDHNTNFETQDIDSVFDGNIEEFIEKYLRNIKNSD